MWLVFALNNPPLFLNPIFYNAFLFTVPATIILTTSLVFVIVSGELDLAFPSVVGAAGGIFMYMVSLGLPVVPAFLATLGFGAATGLGIGLIVVYGKISSLVATLGLNFFILGLVNLLAQGRTISAPDAVGTVGHDLFVGRRDRAGQCRRARHPGGGEADRAPSGARSGRARRPRGAAEVAVVGRHR